MTDLECDINTRGFAEYLKSAGDVPEGDTVCIAGDMRSSTGRIMSAVSAAVERSGFGVEKRLIPTPAMAYYAMQNGKAGIMVTGSHIPNDRNGIKFYKHNCEVLKPDQKPIAAEVAKIRKEEYAKSAEDSPFGGNGMFKQKKPLAAAKDDAQKAFVQRYLDAFPAGCLSGKTIVVYQHSAVGRDILAQVLERLGAEVVAVGRTSELIPIDTENVTAQDRDLFARLAKESSQTHPFAIVSTDGDSDRPLVIDENGRFYQGDLVGIVACQYLNAKSAAVPISANDSVGITLKKGGIELKQTKIGSPYVIEAMNNFLAQGKTSVVSWEAKWRFSDRHRFPD